MEKRPAILLGVLGAAVVLFALSRTKVGGEAAADAVGFVVNALTPRGIRNNNPGNIEWIENPAKRWRGMIKRDGRFGVFDTPANGVRAIGGELKASIRKGQTIAQAIHEWAPSFENDTASYEAAVVREVGAPASARVVASMLPAMASAIIKHENGQQPYALADIERWVYS